MTGGELRQVLCVLSVSALFSTVSLADVAQYTTKASELPASHSEATDSAAIELRAKHWSLDLSEYQHYQRLMEGPLGKWNPDIDPLMALGMFAESDAQRQRYAELYAQQEYALTDRVLQFQRAYHAAFSRLYPSTRLFEQQLLAPYYQHQNQHAQTRLAKRSMQQQLRDGDRLLVFVSPECQGCARKIQTLLSLLAGIRNSGVDVYVREAADNSAIQDWARDHAINPQWLEQKQLTLNRDEGLYTRLLALSASRNTIALPVFLQRNQQFYALNVQELGL